MNAKTKAQLPSARHVDPSQRVGLNQDGSFQLTSAEVAALPMLERLPWMTGLPAAKELWRVQEGLDDAIPALQAKQIEESTKEFRKRFASADIVGDPETGNEYLTRHQLIQRVRMQQPYVPILPMPHSSTLGNVVGGSTYQVAVPADAVICEIAANVNVVVSQNGQVSLPAAGTFTDSDCCFLIPAGAIPKIYYINGIASVSLYADGTGLVSFKFWNQIG